MRALIWALCFLVIVGSGFGCIWWPDSAQLAQITDHSRQMYEEANRNEVAVRRAAELRAARARLEADVRMLSGQGSSGAATAAELRLLDDESKRYRVDVRSVVPQVATPSAQTPRPSETPSAITGTELVLGLRGRFRDVVAMLADVPRHDVLLSINDITLATSDKARADSPDLDVTVRTTLYRLRDRRVLEEKYATRPLR